MTTLLGPGVSRLHAQIMTGLAKLRGAVGTQGILCVVLGVVTFAVYHSSVHHQFSNYDDPSYVTSNPNVRAGVSAESMAWAMTTLHGDTSYWHPLTWLSHMLDTQLFGLNASSHHLTNVWLHVLNTVLLLLVLARLTGRLWPALAAAGLFALHPINVESVAWISERKNLLSTTFALLTLWAYWRYATAPRLRSYLVVVLSFCLGLMTKPMLVTLPVLLLLLDFWPLRRARLTARAGAAQAIPAPSFETESGEPSAPGRESQAIGRMPRLLSWLALLVEKIPLLLLSLGCSILAFIAQVDIGATWPLESLPLSSRFANALVSIWRYLGKLLVPTDLALLYPHPLHWPTSTVVVSLVGVVFVTWWVARRRERFPHLFFGWFWFLVSLGPVIGIIQVGGQAMADRYAYLTFIGLFVAVSWTAVAIVARLRPQPRWLAAGGAALALVLASGTYRQLQRWETPLKIWEHTWMVTRDNAYAAQIAGGLTASVGRHRNAVEWLRKALEIEPHNGQSLLLLAESHQALGEPMQAERYYRAARKFDGAAVRAECGLGQLRFDAADWAGSARHFERALRLSSIVPDAIERMVTIKSLAPDCALRNPERALRLARRLAILAGPTSVPALNSLALAYAANGDYASAIEKAAALRHKALRFGHVDRLREADSQLRDLRLGRSILDPGVSAHWVTQAKSSPVATRTAGAKRITDAERLLRFLEAPPVIRDLSFVASGEGRASWPIKVRAKWQPNGFSVERIAVGPSEAVTNSESRPRAAALGLRYWHLVHGILRVWDDMGPEAPASTNHDGSVIRRDFLEDMECVLGLGLPQVAPGFVQVDGTNLVAATRSGTILRGNVSVDDAGRISRIDFKAADGHPRAVGRAKLSYDATRPNSWFPSRIESGTDAEVASETGRVYAIESLRTSPELLGTTNFDIGLVMGSVTKVDYEGLDASVRQLASHQGAVSTRAKIPAHGTWFQQTTFIGTEAVLTLLLGALWRRSARGNAQAIDKPIQEEPAPVRSGAH